MDVNFSSREFTKILNRPHNPETSPPYNPPHMNSPPNERELLKTKADTLTESEVTEVLEYIAIMQAMRQQSNEPAPFYHALAGVFFKARTRQRGRALRH